MMVDKLAGMFMSFILIAMLFIGGCGEEPIKKSIVIWSAEQMLVNNIEAKLYQLRSINNIECGEQDPVIRLVLHEWNEEMFETMVIITSCNRYILKTIQNYDYRYDYIREGITILRKR